MDDRDGKIEPQGPNDGGHECPLPIAVVWIASDAKLNGLSMGTLALAR
jgi:hypothetical protein